MQPSTASSTMYSGTVRLDFDRKSHTYTVADERGMRTVPSVTQILGIIDKSGPLTQWAANMTTEYIKAAIRPGMRYDEVQLAGIIDQARFNFRSVSRNAKNIGQLAHEWIEGHLRAMLHGGADPELPVNEQARSACQAAAIWISQHFTPRAMEHRIYSRESEYAGTLDVYGEVDGFPAIVDWKSSAAIYREFRLQTAAYAAAWAEMHDERVPNRWVIRLDKETGEFEPVNFPREDFRADLRGFLAAKTLHMRLEAIKTPRAAAAPKPAPAPAMMMPAPASRPMTPPAPAVWTRGATPQQKGLAPAANGNQARPSEAAYPAASVAHPSTAPRRTSRRRSEPTVSFTDMGGALVLSGQTFTIKEELKQIGGHGRKAGSGQFVWEVPAPRFRDLEGICHRHSIRLVSAAAADGSLHVARA